KRAQFAGADIIDHNRYSTKHDLHLSCEQVGHPTAAIRDMKHVNAGLRHEQFARDVAQGPGAERGHVDLARIGLGMAINSGTVLAGRDGVTAITKAERATPATATMSSMKLKLSLS